MKHNLINNVWFDLKFKNTIWLLLQFVVIKYWIDTFWSSKYEDIIDMQTGFTWKDTFHACRKTAVIPEISGIGQADGRDGVREFGLTPQLQECHVVGLLGLTWGQFHQRSKSSRSREHKKDSQVVSLFALSGSSRLRAKAALRTMIKLTHEIGV